MTAELNTREAAELLSRWYGSVTPGTLRNWRHDGRGPTYLPGRPVTYGKDELVAWAISELAEEPRRIVNDFMKNTGGSDATD